MESNLNILILYYSLTGNVKYIAEKMADIFHCEIIDINTVSSQKFNKLKLLKDYFIHTNCELNLIEDELSQYDLIIYGYPIWMFNKVHPLFSKLKAIMQNNNQHYALFASYSFFSWNFSSKAEKDKNCIHWLTLKSPLFFNEIESNKQITKWTNEIITNYKRNSK